ncbi:MAG TPA: hypothetical protein VLF20_02355 [Patescibacteria group bacterium]|nr:hypothetical protein [Patescibacteria group bacterium]
MPREFDTAGMRHVPSWTSERPLQDSWKEIAERLSPERTTVAEMAFAVTLMRVLVNENKKNRRRTIRTRLRERYSTEGQEEVRKDLKGLLDAYGAMEKGESDPTAEKDTGNYQTRIRRVKKYLDEERTKLYRRAEQLDDKGLEELRNGVEQNIQIFTKRRLHGKQRELMHDLTGLEIENVLKGYGSAFGLNMATLAAIEVGALGGGITAVNLGVLDKVDPSIMGLLAGGSYGFLIGSMCVAAYSTLRSLEQTGFSTNLGAKAGFDLIAPYTDSRWKRYWYTLGGYSTKDGIMELVWATGLLGAFQLSALAAKDIPVFIVGGNLGATLVEYSIAGGTTITARIIRRRKQKERALI